MTQIESKLLTKSPLTPFCQRGEPIVIPLWYLFPPEGRQRGIEGDFKMEIKERSHGLAIREIFH
jgi:hypothetical protein